MSTPATAPAAGSDAPLSKAELRRRRILAKRGQRMALVTGDQALATTDSITPSFTPARPASSAPAETAAPAPVAPAPPRAASAPAARPRRATAKLALPVFARVLLVSLCGLCVPIVRSHLFARASALQLFLAAEAVALAPELAAYAGAGGGEAGVLGLLSALLGVSRTLVAVGRDATTFLLALFLALRLTT